MATSEAVSKNWVLHSTLTMKDRQRCTARTPIGVPLSLLSNSTGPDDDPLNKMNFTQETTLLLELLDDSKKFEDISSVLDCLQSIFLCKILSTDSLSSDLISTDILIELERYTCCEKVSLYFGKSLQELKCVLRDEENLREHEMFLQFRGPLKLTVTSVNLPYSSWQDQVFSTIEDIVSAFKQHLEGLAGYFQELECIDRRCTVMEPVNPSFKEDYRRIILDDRTWLHVEVTPDGLATNIHLIGQSEYWQDKLQEGLIKWDYDINIIQNIMHIFDISEFPTANKLGFGPSFEGGAEKPECSICLCDELPDITGVPLPLCQNPACGIYFHRTCLFQWLVACAGGRPPAFGVATGSCPTCLQPIACNENDS